MSYTRDPPESAFGGDNVEGYGPEVRRIILHMVDLAQPYVRMQPGSVANDNAFDPGTTVSLKWQVNGSMVVDHTYVQWGSAPDPNNNYTYTTGDFDANAGMYVGGTGWEGASSGGTPLAVTYSQDITLPMTPGDYYFVAKAKVDQVYNHTLGSAEYDANHSYLRLLKERMQPGYSEDLNGTDGTEHMEYSEWWYGPVIKLTVKGTAPSWAKIPVVAGWNLISSPLVPVSSALPGALVDRDGDTKWDRAQWYDPYDAANHWKQYNSGWSASLNDLPNFNASMGIWVNITVVGDGFLNLSGAIPSSTSIPLHTGWNMAGYPSLNSTKTVGEALWGTGATMVEAFDVNTTYRTKVVGPNYVMRPGEGYWVYVPADTIWTIDW
jgi:hypothetical protein